MSFLPHQATRKRRAASPPLTPDPPFTTTSPWDPTPLPAKRRRPNLANGFSGLSLASSPLSDEPLPSSLPSYAESQQLEAARKQIDDDDDLFADPVAYDHNDVGVEEVHSRPRRPLPGQRSDSSSTSGYSSDTIPPLRRRTTRQADEVEMPPEETYVNDGVGVEDVTLQSRKRRSASADDGREGPSKRARDEMDVEMGDIEEIPRRKRSEWYEPEKDRIVYTALSSSSRSPSPERSDSPPQQLIQPGENGFTISPSMLTRLLANTDHSIPLPFPQHREMGLVLYRPMGIPPGVNMSQPDLQNIVREWQGRVRADGDSGRFESLDEDEEVAMDVPELAMETEGDMDVDMS